MKNACKIASMILALALLTGCMGIRIGRPGDAAAFQFGKTDPVVCPPPDGTAPTPQK